MKTRRIISSIACAALVVAFSITALAQNRVGLRGAISDEFGASIVGATVTITDAAGGTKTATTSADGTYAFTGLAPGKYKIQAASSGFAPSEETEIEVAAGRRDPVNITLKIAAIETQVKVNADTPLSTETGNNANQHVITGKDLDALPDDPDELAAALQALAGPAIGPSGGQIFIDGFSGSNMPPKDSIREIRINQNPFSPENDQPSARIDILTRPGSDKLRGGASINFTDEALNTRNPFLTSSTRPPYQVRQYSFNIGGPIVKHKASFFFDANRNETDDNDLLRATVLDSAFVPQTIGAGLLVPRRNTNLSPRVDWQINAKNTLVARYNYFHQDTQNNGVGGFSLPSRGYPFSSTNHNIQLTETMVINATTINETRFQYFHNRSESLGNATIPVLNVSSSFTGGGSQVGHAINERSSWEINNFTQMQHGMHTLKFGARFRGVSIDDISPNNFGGQWIFTGGFGPQFDANNNPVAGSNVVLSSLERYRRTVLVQQTGLTAAQQAYCGAGTSVNDCIRKLGGGASQFSKNAGNPAATVSQTDLSLYWQDDWRIRPNFTLNYGLRYEGQTNIDSKFNFAPRIGFAWSPGAGNATKPPKMVIRGGGGIFYNRFNEGQTLTANRFNGTNQQIYAVPEPFSPGAPPSQAQLDAFRGVYDFLGTFQCLTGGPTNCIASNPSVAGIPATQQTIWQVAPTLQAPAVYLVGLQAERQLPHNLTVTAGVFSLRIQHVIRARDINAPLPGTITAANPAGVRPIPTLGDINQFESSGKYRQSQMFIGFNSRLNPNFSLQGTYVLAKQENDTDGQGGSLFPMNSYDLSGEWGRGSFDIRHRFTLIGNINSPWWKLTFSPLLVLNSGAPFNITTGADTNLDRQFNERPTFAQLNAFCQTRADRCTTFDYSSTSNAFIPRNYGRGTGSVSVNVRVSRTFGFGGEANRRASSSQGGGANKTASNSDGKRGNTGGGRGGPSIGGGAAGGGHGPGGGGPQMMAMGPGGPGGAGGPAKYNLTLSVNFLNVLNHANFAPPVGNLTSPNFGLPVSVTGGGFGGFGGFGGGGTGAGNRKVYLSARFTF